MKSIKRIALLLAAAAASWAPAAAHDVYPPTIQMRPGATDFIYVADLFGCAASITATSPDPSLLSVAAVNMSNGSPLSSGKSSVTVPNRVDQVFAVYASPMATSATVKVEICWVGETAPNLPCDENNCNPYAPHLVTVNIGPYPEGHGASLLSSYFGDPVDMRRGELFFSDPDDLSLGGPLPLGIHRNYSSTQVDAGAPPSALGPNWRHNFDWVLQLVGNNVEIWSDEGRLIRFERGYLQSNWVLAGNQSVPFQLVESGGDFILGDPRDDTVRTFDPLGRLTMVEDGHGNAHALAYASGRLSTVSDGFGRMLSFGYGMTGELTSVSDGTRTVSYTHDGLGRLATSTDAGGNTTTNTYDPAFPGDALLTGRTLGNGTSPLSQTWNASKQVASQTDGVGNTTTFAFGLAGGAASATRPNMETQTHTHGTSQGVTGWTDEAGNSATVDYDGSDRRATVTDRFGSDTKTTYDAISGKPRRITEADGSRTTLSYVSRTFKGITFRDVSSILEPDGGTTSLAYDGAGNALSVTVPGGATWGFTYNGFGQVLTTTNPEGGVTTLGYDGIGRLVSTSDASGNTTAFAYDLLNRVDGITFADGTTASYAFDPLDRLLTTTDALGRVWSNSYDGIGNLLDTQDPDGATTSFCYDLANRLCGVTNPLGNATTAAYDVNGLLQSITKPEGNTITFGHNGLGQRISITDAIGKTWSQTQDVEGAATSRTAPTGSTESFASDDRGRIVQRTNAVGGTIGYSWDPINRITKRQGPLGNAANFVYGADRNLQQVKLAVPGMVTNLSYNGLGQITSLTGPNNSTWTWQLDPAGHWTSFSDPLGRTTSLVYDVNNNPTTATYADGATGTYTLDDGDRPTDLAFSDGINLSYQWDAMDRLKVAANFTADYDLAGQVTDSNGIAATYTDNGLLQTLTYGPGLVVTYDYFANDKLKSVTDWLGGFTNFGYDDAGNEASWTRPNGVGTDYSYDANGALKWIQHRGIADVTLRRDASGRITDSTSTWPTTGLPDLGKQTFSVDAAYQVNGFNWSARGQYLGDTKWNYTWNGAGRLASVDNGTNFRNLDYDGLGQLTQVDYKGTVSDLITSYQFRNPSIAIERENGADRFYDIRTPEGTLLHQVDATTGDRYYPLYDENYSTRAVTDDMGVVVAGYDYSPWGDVTAQTGTFDTRFRWRGGAGYYAVGCLYYYRGRYVYPELARYLSPAYEGSNSPLGVNPYQLDGANPLAFGDVYRNQSDWTGSAGRPFNASEFRFFQASYSQRYAFANDVRWLPRLADRLATVGVMNPANEGSYVLRAAHLNANHRKTIRKFRAAAEFAKAFLSFAEHVAGPPLQYAGGPRSVTLRGNFANDAPFTWEAVTPRIGLTYELGESGKTLVRSNYATYADNLGVSQALGSIRQLGYLGYSDFGDGQITSNPASALWDVDSAAPQGGNEFELFVDTSALFLDPSGRDASITETGLRAVGGNPTSRAVLPSSDFVSPRRYFIGARIRF